MQKLIAVLGVAGCLLATSSYANLDYGATGSITLYQNGLAPYAGDGGEFTAVTSGLGTFPTFCLELTEEFGSGSSYTYRVNSGAVEGGGPAGGALTSDPYTGLPMDNISIGTAWLYSQFRSGALNISTGAQAGGLQNAIWYLEGEISLAQLSTQNGANGTPYFSDALTHYGLTPATAGIPNVSGIFADSGGAFGVVALNLYNGPYATTVTGPTGATFQLNQDQLAIVPEPTTLISGALLLLPFGASTLRILRRNRAV